MRSIAEQLERVKNLLEESLEELKKVREAYLAMRELEISKQIGSEEVDA